MDDDKCIDLTLVNELSDEVAVLFNEGNGTYGDALTDAIEGVLAADDVESWVTRINAAGVPAGPVLDLAQVFADPQVLARHMRVELPHPVVGTFQTTGLPVKLSGTPGAITRRPPLHGEHTHEVLSESGFSDSEIGELRARGVI